MTSSKSSWLWVLVPFVLGAALVLAGAVLLEADTVPSFEYAM